MLCVGPDQRPVIQRAGRCRTPIMAVTSVAPTTVAHPALCTMRRTCRRCSPTTSTRRGRRRSCSPAARSAARPTARRCSVFRLNTPVELGGYELPLAEQLDVLERFARLDGSIAWNVWNGNIGFIAAMIPDAGVAAIWGDDSDPVIANSARLTGTAVASDGGYLLSGRWDIVSAVDSANWVVLFGMIVEGGGPRFVAPGVPDIRAFVLPTSSVTVIDSWQVNAMRGTGSNTVVVDAAWVPEELAPSPTAAPRIDRPLYRLPAFTLASSGCAAAVLASPGRRSTRSSTSPAASRPTTVSRSPDDHTRSARSAGRTPPGGRRGRGCSMRRRCSIVPWATAHRSPRRCAVPCAAR